MKASIRTLVCTRILPLLVINLAILIGWLANQPIPEGTLFTFVYTIGKGYVPPAISGGFSKSPVPPVPEDFQSVLTATAAEESKYITLTGTGDKMPQQGLGMCCRYTAYDAESVRRTVLWYLLLGGRHIDTADIYQNHEWIGEALQYAIQNYGIKRKDIFITTKVWPRLYGYNSTLTSIERMKKELKLDYLDLVLMHAPSENFDFFGKLVSKNKLGDCKHQKLDTQTCRYETWKAMSMAKSKGYIRNAGVSNFNKRQLSELNNMEYKNVDKEVMAKVPVAPIATNQFQYNPWVPQFLHETFDYCQENNIAVTAWSSLAGTMMQGAEAFTIQTLTGISKKYNKSVAQVLLRWACQKGILVIPGTGNPKHMKENLDIYNFVLSNTEIDQIDDLRKDEQLVQKFGFIPENDS